MSEVEKIIGQFRTARYFERTASGQNPVVCVAGRTSYLELETSLCLKHGAILKDSECWNGWMEFENVKIYPSESFEEGFYFGCIEPPP